MTKSETWRTREAELDALVGTIFAAFEMPFTVAVFTRGSNVIDLRALRKPSRAPGDG